MVLTLNPSSDPEAVPLNLLRRYLVANGWRRPEGGTVQTIPSQQSAIMRAVLEGRTGGQRTFERFVMSEDQVEGVEIILPRTSSSPDNMRLLRGALRTLSDVHGQDLAKIFDAIRSVGFDIMRSRIPNDMVVDDTISLEIAINYVTGVRADSVHSGS